MERRLHRGLESLMGKARIPPGGGSSLQAVPVESVRPNPRQPRRRFDDAKQRELQESIDRDGVLQPIVVRRVEGGYELIAGERRLRACQALGIVRIPAVVRTAEESEQLALAMVENVQRTDLDPIEEARGYQQLVMEFGMTHDEVAARVGKDRSTVSNAIRLLELPDEVQQAISEGRLRAGHARALLPLVGRAEFPEVFDRVCSEGLSVRKTEELARGILAGGLPANEEQHDLPETDAEPAGGPSADGLEQDLERRLQGLFGVRVRVRIKRRGGSVTFVCGHRRELDYLLERLEQVQSGPSGSQEPSFPV